MSIQTHFVCDEVANLLGMGTVDVSGMAHLVNYHAVVRIVARARTELPRRAKQLLRPETQIGA